MIRLWWSRTGAEGGHPWRVQRDDGAVTLHKRVTIAGGVVQTRETPDGLVLPDGPRGIIEVSGGTIVTDPP